MPGVGRGAIQAEDRAEDRQEERLTHLDQMLEVLTRQAAELQRLALATKNTSRDLKKR
jgi:hypothetical protein